MHRFALSRNISTIYRSIFYPAIKHAYQYKTLSWSNLVNLGQTTFVVRFGQPWSTLNLGSAGYACTRKLRETPFSLSQTHLAKFQPSFTQSRLSPMLTKTDHASPSLTTVSRCLARSERSTGLRCVYPVVQVSAHSPIQKLNNAWQDDD